MPTGIYKRTREHGVKISQAIMGHRTSDETREKIKESNLGKKRSEMTKMNMSISMQGLKRHLGIKHTEETKHKMSLSHVGLQTGESNGSWKGDNIGYSGLHGWIRKILGKANNCEECLTTKARRYEWANINGEYKREPSDWKQLCRKCHIAFDKREGRWGDASRKFKLRKYGGNIAIL